MPYYHDPLKRIVAFAPPEPNVHLRPGKRGAPGIWHVTATIEYTIADNYTRPGTNQWALDVRGYHQEDYLESRDSREEAVRYFKMTNYPSMPEVDFQTYERFRAEYDAIARSNAAPKKK